MEERSCTEFADVGMKVSHLRFQSCWTMEASHSDHWWTEFRSQMLLSPINIQSHVWNDTKCSKNFLNCFMTCNVISEIMESVIKQYDKKWDNETNWVWNLSRWVIFCFVLSLVPIYMWWDEMMVENPVLDSSHIIHMIHNLFTCCACARLRINFVLNQMVIYFKSWF